MLRFPWQGQLRAVLSIGNFQPTQGLTNVGLSGVGPPFPFLFAGEERLVKQTDAESASCVL